MNTETAKNDKNAVARKLEAAAQRARMRRVIAEYVNTNGYTKKC